MSDSFSHLDSFDDFVNSIFEASTLTKTGMPKGMVTAVHTKAEHWDEYPRMAHTYRGKVAIPMEYEYYQPSHDIEITEPTVLTGSKSRTSPFTGREVGSLYTDFHWFIESLPLGTNRAVIANPDLDFFMYIYHKSKSKGATGFQYAILWWDPEQKKAVDFGYSELTTRAVDRAQIRQVHDTKGGNRSDKIQEFIRSVTTSGKDYAPSRSKPLYAYRLAAEYSAESPRAKRGLRKKTVGPVLSKDFITVFADKAKSIVKLAPDQFKQKLASKLVPEYRWFRAMNAQPPVVELAEMLGTDSAVVYAALFERFAKFRKMLFDDGLGAYAKTSGFDLEADRKAAGANFYEIKKKRFSPDEERAQPEQGYREAQPEQYKREMPIAAPYASIESIIRLHSMDGAFQRFMYFILTDRISEPKVSMLGLLGIDLEKEGLTALPGMETWLL
jgi:hypothetical protein